MKSPIFPADGSSPCVVIPKISSIEKQEYNDHYHIHVHPTDPRDLLYVGMVMMAACLSYDTAESRDEAYNRLIEAIREWYE